MQQAVALFMKGVGVCRAIANGETERRQIIPFEVRYAAATFIPTEDLMNRHGLFRVGRKRQFRDIDD